MMLLSNIQFNEVRSVFSSISPSTYHTNWIFTQLGIAAVRSSPADEGLTELRGMIHVPLGVEAVPSPLS